MAIKFKADMTVERRAVSVLDFAVFLVRIA